VTVEGATPVLETTSNMISGTLSNQSLNNLPRNVFGFAVLIPGAAAPVGGPHFNGMPAGTLIRRSTALTIRHGQEGRRARRQRAGDADI
jgi:hypothetical protein